MGTTKTEDGQDALAGVLVAFGPGQSLNSTEEQVISGWNPFIEKADEYTKKWWEEYVRLCPLSFLFDLPECCRSGFPSSTVPAMPHLVKVPRSGLGIFSYSVSIPSTMGRG